jgi:hypothetical protein
MDPADHTLRMKVKADTQLVALVETKHDDLKAVNPHAKAGVDTRTPEELLDIVEQKEREAAEELAELRKRK